MKKYILAMALMGAIYGLQAQEGFKIGIQGGIPFGDFDDQISVMVGLDLGYMHALGEVVDVGITSGLIHGFAETFQTTTPNIDFPSVQFVPLAGSVRIWPSNSLSFGVDGGYALGLGDDNDGGLYYRPLIGYLLGPKTELNLSYTSISSNDRSWTTVTLGILYTFQL